MSRRAVQSGRLIPWKDALHPDAEVAIASCKTHAPQEVRAAYDQRFDLLGGVGPRVKGKTVAIIRAPGSRPLRG